MVFSLVGCLLFGLFLSMATSYDRKILIHNYVNRYESQNKYVDSILKMAEQEYQIHFDAEIVRILKEHDSYRSMIQVSDLRELFSGDEKVALKVIILEKIAVHNNKIAPLSLRFWPDWHYATPENIYRQLKFYQAEDPEAKELMLLLKEQIDLRNFSGIDPEEIIPQVELTVLNHAVIVDSVLTNQKYSALAKKIISESDVEKLKKYK